MSSTSTNIGNPGRTPSLNRLETTITDHIPTQTPRSKTSQTPNLYNQDIPVTSPSKEKPTSQLIQLKLETDILGAIAAVVVGEAAAGDDAVLAHVGAPGVVGVARQQPVGADLNAVGP